MWNLPKHKIHSLHLIKIFLIDSPLIKQTTKYGSDLTIQWKVCLQYFMWIIKNREISLLSLLKNVAWSHFDILVIVSLNKYGNLFQNWGNFFRSSIHFAPLHSNERQARLYCVETYNYMNYKPSTDNQETMGDCFFLFLQRFFSTIVMHVNCCVLIILKKRVFWIS